MNFTVYILHSYSTNSFYKGQTSDINARIKRHNDKLEKATQSGSPWKLIWSIRKDSRKDALILERKLKNLDRNRLVMFMLKYSEGVAGPDALMLTRESASKSQPSQKGERITFSLLPGPSGT